MEQDLNMLKLVDQSATGSVQSPMSVQTNTNVITGPRPLGLPYGEPQ
jgi:hypothetical protein